MKSFICPSCGVEFSGYSGNDICPCCGKWRVPKPNENIIDIKENNNLK